MVVIEQPTEVKLKELPKGTPFKYIKGEQYATYIKIGDVILILNTGEVRPLNQEDIVQAYKDIKVITKPITKSIEISKIPCEKLNVGGCCIYKDTAYMKTEKGDNAWVVMFNLERRCLETFKLTDKVLPAPFLCLELV